MKKFLKVFSILTAERKAVFKKQDGGGCGLSPSLCIAGSTTGLRYRGCGGFF